VPNSSITLAYSTHRPEILPFAEAAMQHHDVIILEEPKMPEFQAMLQGIMPVEDYVLLMDTEYPEFSIRMARMMQKMYRQGKRIFQIEPFLDELLAIQEHFAAGGNPDDILPGSLRFSVYECEKIATGYLLDYYQCVIYGSFMPILKAIQRFARADASRFRLRDRLRAEAIALMAGSFRSAYVETGEMHLALWPELKKRFLNSSQLQKCYLMAPVVRKICGKNRIMGPGDQLTAHYLFSCPPSIAWEDLMAGRSLIYSKILQKEELIDTSMDYPHTRNEIETILAVRRLSLKDCQLLFKHIRYKTTPMARRVVADYLKGLKKY
jgi:hypothetical protein